MREKYLFSQGDGTQLVTQEENGQRGGREEEVYPTTAKGGKDINQILPSSQPQNHTFTCINLVNILEIPSTNRCVSLTFSFICDPQPA